MNPFRMMLLAAAVATIGGCSVESQAMREGSYGYKGYEAIAAGDILLKANPPDEANAAKYYRIAAEAGDPWGMYKYGNALRDGKGVPKDPAAAAVQYQAAADKGNHWGQYSLGELYLDGNGVEKDPEKARILFEKAAAQNSASVYGTAVNTAVGANSQPTAAIGPPSRASAMAAR